MRCFLQEFGYLKMEGSLLARARRILKINLLLSSGISTFLLFGLVYSLYTIQITIPVAAKQINQSQQLLFILQEIASDISKMEASNNTFALNEQSSSLRQKLFKLDEALFGLELGTKVEARYLTLLESIDKVRTAALHTRDIQQRRLEREVVVQRLMTQILQFQGEVNQSKYHPISNVGELRETVALLSLILAQPEAFNAAKQEQQFKQRLLVLAESGNADITSLTQQLQILGIGESGLFPLLMQAYALEFSAQSNREINDALLVRTLSAAESLLQHLNQDIVVKRQWQQNVMIYTFIAALVLVLMLIFRLLVSQRRFRNHLVQRLELATQVILKKSTSKDNISSADFDGLTTGASDEISELLSSCGTLFGRMQRRNQELEVLGAIGRELTQVTDLETLQMSAQHLANTFMRNESALLGLWQSEKSVYEFTGCFHGAQYHDINNHYPQVQSLLNELGKRSKTALIPSLNELKHYVKDMKNQDWKSIGSLLIIPLESESSGYLGCLCFCSAREKAFTPGRVASLEILGDYLSTAVQQAKLNETLHVIQNKLHMLEKMSSMKALGRASTEQMLVAIDTGHQSMGAIKMSLQQLQDIVVSESSQTDDQISEFTAINQYLESAEQEIQVVKEGLEELHSFTEPDARQVHKVALNALIHSCFVVMKPKFPHINFETQGQTNLELECFEEKIQQVIIDVLLNSCLAIKQRQTKTHHFTPDVSFRFTTDESQLTILVEDNGLRMPEDAYRQLFEPNFDGAKMMAGERISLAVAARVVEEHNGEIKAFANGSYGNILSIKLPLKQSPKKDESVSS